MAEKKQKTGSLGPSGKPDDSLAIIGIGASAGGLVALKTFFDNVPENSGLAFVVVVHLSPDHESLMPQLLQPHARMPVTQVTDAVALQPNHIYIIPPRAQLSAIDTHLRVSQPETKHARGPIDHFFRTLAQTHQGNAVGVILTGTGSDGTLGIKAIKEAGGMVVAQNPADAEFDGMPRSAIATGLVDLVLPVNDMPAQILRILKIRPALEVPAESGSLEERERKNLDDVFALVRSRSHRDFSRYKSSTSVRRIRRRMQLRQVEKLEDYLQVLREQPEEVAALADEFLINVTNFFRDPPVYAAL